MTSEQRQNVAAYMANFEILIGVVSESLENISTGAITASRMALKDDETNTVNAIKVLLGSVKRLRNILNEDYKTLETRLYEIVEPKSESDTSQT